MLWVYECFVQLTIHGLFHTNNSYVFYETFTANVATLRKIQKRYEVKSFVNLMKQTTSKVRTYFVAENNGFVNRTNEFNSFQLHLHSFVNYRPLLMEVAAVRVL